MKVYVATAFGNRAEARGIISLIQAHGHEVSHDWTHEYCDPSWPIERQAAYMQACGTKDFNGVQEADALVFVNHKDCRDAMTEFGIALGADIPVIVLYPERRGSVFFHYAVAQRDSIEGLIEWLNRW